MRKTKNCITALAMVFIMVTGLVNPVILFANSAEDETHHFSNEADYFTFDLGLYDLFEFEELHSEYVFAYEFAESLQPYAPMTEFYERDFGDGRARAVPSDMMIPQRPEEFSGFAGVSRAVAPMENGFIAPIPPIPAGVNVVQISTQQQLADIGGADSEGRYFVLTNDINLVGGWTPIEDFRGTLDGRGFRINGLFVLGGSQHHYAGLFGYLAGANVRNLGINIGSQGIAGAWAGGLAGWVQQANIFNVFVDGGNVTGINYAGGLIGDFNVPFKENT